MDEFPQPSLPPPASVPARVGAGRVRVLFLVAGMILGAGAITVVDRVRPIGTATIYVDNSVPRTAGASSGDAVAVAQQLGPAVGTIIARAPGGKDGLGSGVVVAHTSDTSYLLTNNHVVSGSHDLHAVMPGGHNLVATLVGTDALDDLAVVSVIGGSLPVATFGPSAQLKVGQAVVAIGSPLGNEGSVTRGVVSALHRTINAGGDTGNSSETLQDVLQTDASINPGNSGGPLADAQGRIVGINVAIAGNASNIGFSIPSDLAQVVADELIGHRAVQHPFLGIAYLTSTEAIEAGNGFDGPGVLVRDVRSGTPAAKAGFRTGDVLAAVDGIDIDNGETLGGLIQRHRVGDVVAFTLQRAGQKTTASATLVERPGVTTP